jgi:hypothetical protein
MGYQEEFIEGYDDDGHVVLKCYNGEEASCFCFRDALRHRFTSPGVRMAEWRSIQQNDTRYLCKSKGNDNECDFGLQFRERQICQITHVT